MKTTQQLIELQRSITQGEWKTFAKWAPYQQKPSVQCGLEQIAVCQDYNSNCYTEEQVNNARAIALVPELLAEVIRLRVALGLIVEECSEQQVTENAIVTSRPSLLCLEQCRAALADAK